MDLSPELRGETPREGVVVWPKGGASPVDFASRNDFYDSMYHSAGAVGINTSAQIECGIVGRPVSIGGQPHTILGVAPRAVEAMTDPDVFTLLPVPKVSTDRTNSHQVVGRIKPDVGRSRAQAEIDAVARRHAEASPALTNMPQGVVLRSLQEDAVAPVQPALRLLTVAVLLVLLIACSNVANVVLARGFVRRRELALMAALGSARWRVVRSVITENLVIAAMCSSRVMPPGSLNNRRTHSLARTCGIPRRALTWVANGVLPVPLVPRTKIFMQSS